MKRCIFLLVFFSTAIVLHPFSSTLHKNQFWIGSTMYFHKIFNSFIALLILAFTFISSAQSQPENQNGSKMIQHVQHWLEQEPAERPDLASTGFAAETISKDDALQVTALLWDDYKNQIRSQYQDSWDAKQFQYEDYIMKFEYKTFGKKPADGRNLYISMHGGGNAPARLNDQQWKNQIGLYEPEEGIYLAPRAPSNEWNLWHLPHIDVLFDQIIQSAVVFEDVNPNRVYIMGYSAGGDGVFQLAPRLADRWAAAAMMAGHPNETVPLGLRNIGFTLHMGGDDAAYDRNKIAREWKVKLGDLQKEDPDGYVHEVVIHEGKGHWMDHEDKVAVEWMAKFTRNPNPKIVVWKQDDVTHSRFYWLEVDTDNHNVGSLITASIAGQTITIEKADDVKSIIINLNDELVDMDQPIQVKHNDKVLFDGKVSRNIESIYKTLTERGDPDLIFSGSINVDISN
jgi:hypothetical protein